MNFWSKLIQFQGHSIHCKFKSAAFQIQFKLWCFSVLLQIRMAVLQYFLENKTISCFYRLPMQFLQLREDKSWKFFCLLWLHDSTISKEMRTPHLGMRKWTVTIPPSTRRQGSKSYRSTQMHLLLAGTKSFDQLLSYETESTNIEFIGNQLPRPEWQSQDETSETEISWKLSNIQPSDVGSSLAVSYSNEICIPSSESEKQFTIWLWEDYIQLFCQKQRNTWRENGCICSGSICKRNKADRLDYHSESLWCVQQQGVYDSRCLNFSEDWKIRCYNVFPPWDYASVKKSLYRCVQNHSEKTVKAPLQHTLFLEIQKPLQKRIEPATLLSCGQCTPQGSSKVTCSLKQFMNIFATISASGRSSQSWSSWNETLISSRASTVRQILFAFLKKVCALLEVVEQSDKECILAKDCGASVHLKASGVLGMATLGYKVSKATYVRGDWYPEAGNSNKLDCFTGAGIKWDNQNDKPIYGLERIKSKIYKESKIEINGNWNEALQDKVHVFWTKLPSLRTRTYSEDATSFGDKVLGELLVSLPAIYMHSSGASIKMYKALTVYFFQKCVMQESK